MLFAPLFMRGAGEVIISIVCLTSVVESGLPFFVFPQALTVNGFGGAVMGATFGPAVVGEWFSHVLARNSVLLGGELTATDTVASRMPLEQLYGTVMQQALVVSMKEIFGWLLMASLASLTVILLTYSGLRPHAIFPKWKTIRRGMRLAVRRLARADAWQRTRRFQSMVTFKSKINLKHNHRF